MRLKRTKFVLQFVGGVGFAIGCIFLGHYIVQFIFLGEFSFGMLGVPLLLVLSAIILDILDGGNLA